MNVRSTPNGTIVGVQKGGGAGTQSGTPVQSGAYTWVYVDFDTGVDGYVAQSYLHSVGAPAPTTNPNQAKIEQLLQLLALLRQMLATLLAQQGS